MGALRMTGGPLQAENHLISGMGLGLSETRGAARTQLYKKSVYSCL